MRLQRTLRLTVWLFLLIWAVSASALLVASEPKDNRSVAERIVSSAKKSGNKIEQGFAKAAKKFEQQQLGEKVVQKLKRAGKKTAEGFKKAGEQFDQKFRK